MSFIEDVVEHREAEWEQPLSERIAKVMVVGLATAIAGALFEDLYDRAFRKEDPETETEES